MKTLPIVAILCLAASGALAVDQTAYNTAKATIAIELDREEWSAIEPITGKLIFQMTEARDSNGRALDAVKLNQPTIDIVFPDEMALVLPEVRWRTVFFPTVKVGHRYELAFSIRVNEEFAKLLKAGDEPIALFKPGRYAISATIDSPQRPVWEDDRKKSPFIELHQQFNSGPKNLTIAPARSGRGVSNTEVKRVFGEAEGPLKHEIVTFYARRKVLSREDLLAAIKDAEGKPKAQLAALHLSLNYPPADLTFFTSLSEPVRLKGHPPSPLYLLAKPQQRVRMEFDLGEMHRLRVAKTDIVLASKKNVDLEAPQAEGVYEMHDDAHGKPWGWLLVKRDHEAVAAAGLRPDTRELSAKVVDALVKQDAGALAALGAPGMRVNDVLKKVRFQLGDGDVRYHESTGGSTKVKTILKINVAPKDKEPVYAKELWLDFVLVGEDLKLTNAAVWDVEK